MHMQEPVEVGGQCWVLLELLLQECEVLWNAGIWALLRTGMAPNQCAIPPAPPLYDQCL